jgi:hypothetical protein
MTTESIIFQRTDRAIRRSLEIAETLAPNNAAVQAAIAEPVPPDTYRLKHRHKVCNS